MSTHADPDSFRTSVESLSPEQLEGWLDRALRGEEPLPRLVADEAPDITIGRHERTLESLTRKDLRQAAIALLCGFVDRVGVDPQSDDYVRALVGLVGSFELEDATIPLGTLAQGEAFGSISPEQRAAVLGGLLDLRAALDRGFWVEVAERGEHPALALTGLLRAGVEGLDILARISGDEATADALYVVLSQYARKLEPAGLHRLQDRAQGLKNRCSGPIRRMLEDWLEEQEGALPPEPRPIDEALEKFFALRDRKYVRQPQCARLVPAA